MLCGDKEELYVYLQLIYFSVQKKLNDYKATKFPIKNIITNTKKKAVCIITAMSFLKFLKELENLLLPSSSPMLERVLPICKFH